MDENIIEGSVADHNNAIKHINEKELNECILKLGSFLTIINSKKINQTQLFIQLVESTDLQEISVGITSSPISAVAELN